MVSAPAVMVSGMLAGIPHQGGATWAVLQYVLGLRRLGCEVVFVEPVAAAGALAEIPAAAYFEHVCEQFRLEGSAALMWPTSPSGSSSPAPAGLPTSRCAPAFQPTRSAPTSELAWTRC